MSSKGLVIPGGLVDLEERRENSRDGAEPKEAPRIRAAALEQIRREAFERGREVERTGASRLFAEGARALENEVRQLAQARASDRRELEEVSVRLGCMIAELLVGTLVEAGAHDLRAMIARVLEHVLPDASGETVVLQVHPEDLQLLSNDFLVETGSSSVRVVPNPSLERGALRVVANGAEFYSAVSERLESMKAALLRDLEGEIDGPA